MSEDLPKPDETPAGDVGEVPTGPGITTGHDVVPGTGFDGSPTIEAEAPPAGDLEQHTSGDGGEPTHLTAIDHGDEKGSQLVEDKDKAEAMAYAAKPLRDVAADARRYARENDELLGQVRGIYEEHGRNKYGPASEIIDEAMRRRRGEVLPPADDINERVISERLGEMKRDSRWGLEENSATDIEAVAQRYSEFAEEQDAIADLAEELKGFLLEHPMSEDYRDLNSGLDLSPIGLAREIVAIPRRMEEAKNAIQWLEGADRYVLYERGINGYRLDGNTVFVLSARMEPNKSFSYISEYERLQKDPETTVTRIVEYFIQLYENAVIYPPAARANCAMRIAEDIRSGRAESYQYDAMMRDIKSGKLFPKKEAA